MQANTFILGTAGHIDHGKTALVRALTGVDTDRLPQEKERGITIDLGFASLDLDGFRVGIIDVPGHERFIRNMLAGASGIDMVMLVVAADDSVMPQTREHLAILELLDVHHGLIALSKCDLVEPSWVDLVEEELRELTRGTFLEGAPIVRTSAQRGSGLDELRQALLAICRTVQRESRDEPFRLAVDRSFVAHGVGTVITGTVWSGSVGTGETVEWMPSQKPIRIRGLQSHGSDVERISRGQRAAVNLMNVHHSEIERGHELATPSYLAPSRLMTAHLRIVPGSPWALRHRSRIRLHLGTQEIMAAVRLLDADQIEPGGAGLAQLILATPGIAAGGQPCVIRAQSPLITLGGGRVLQPNARRIRRRSAAALRMLEALRSEDPATRLSVVLRDARGEALTELELARHAAVLPAETPALLESLRQRGEVIELRAAGAQTPVILHRETIEEIEGRISLTLTRMHDAAPLDTGIARKGIVQHLDWLARRAVLEAVIDRMLERDALRSEEGLIALRDFKPRLSQRQMELYRDLIAAFDDAGFSPPDVNEIAQRIGGRSAEVRTLLDLCVASGKLVHIGGPLYMHPEHERKMKERLADSLAKTSALAMSEIRDLLDTSRKYAVPLVEYLDRIGFTERRGDMRVLAGGPDPGE